MTFFETAGQGSAFLLLLCMGAAAGMIGDGVSLLRRRCPRPLGIALDGLCGLVFALLCLFALAIRQENRLRLYALLGMLCGAGLYALGVRQLILGLRHLIHILFLSRREESKKKAA